MYKIFGWHTTVLIFLMIASQVCICYGVSEKTAIDDEKRVLAAIAIMFADPFSMQAVESQKIVINFAERTDKFKVYITEGLGLYPHYKYRELLMAHYIAGAVKFYIKHPEYIQDKHSAIAFGLVATLNVYRQLRARDRTDIEPFLETAIAKSRVNKLDEFIKEILKKSEKENKG